MADEYKTFGASTEPHTKSCGMTFECKLVRESNNKKRILLACRYLKGLRDSLKPEYVKTAHIWVSKSDVDLEEQYIENPKRTFEIAAKLTKY